MKKLCLSLLLGVFFVPLFAQEQQLGLPGDNLNLYGVLNIFQKSPTLETFEKNLNAQDSQVNNLDLNGDGQIDYIHVIDNANGQVHDITLRVDINQTESQDVAVIEVDKDAENHVHVQIVGDEALYGKDYIVEPNQNTPNPGYQGNVSTNTVYYAPDSWAIMSFMFAPHYMVYSSPYHWGYYPHFWHPWRPLSYSVYYGYHRPYYNSYRRSNVYYSPAAHNYYDHHRQSSVIVRNKYHNEQYHNQPNHNPPHPQPHPEGHPPHPGGQQPREQSHQQGQPQREQPHQQNHTIQQHGNQPQQQEHHNEIHQANPQQNHESHQASPQQHHEIHQANPQHHQKQQQGHQSPQGKSKEIKRVK